MGQAGDRGRDRLRTLMTVLGPTGGHTTMSRQATGVTDRHGRVRRGSSGTSQGGHLILTGMLNWPRNVGD